MTDRVEIKPDVEEKSLEQSSEELKKDGIDVSQTAPTTADGTSIEVVDSPKEGQSTEDKESSKLKEAPPRAYSFASKTYVI